MQTLTFAPTADPRRVRAADGRVLDVPAGWECLPPGDAGLTRRVKAAGDSWTVVEKKGRKTFSRGVWAPAAHLTAARAALEAERSTEAYAKKREGELRRREVAQTHYVADFETEVLAFLGFSASHASIAAALAKAVTLHATPVGSGTVARTKRIELDRRAEAAVIAWLRHATTAYDSMPVARVKGARRALRRDLAQHSRALLQTHRVEGAHRNVRCALCAALGG